MARKPPRTLTRRAGRRPERRTVLVFCEGEQSEPDYIIALRSLPEVRDRAAVQIEVDPRQGSPAELVRRAAKRIGDDELDEIWCVFDVEWPANHPNIERAVEEARRNGIRLAISNPCFEIWLVLHVEDLTSFGTPRTPSVGAVAWTAAPVRGSTAGCTSRAGRRRSPVPRRWPNGTGGTRSGSRTTTRRRR